MDRAIYVVAKAISAGGRAKKESLATDETLGQKKILMPLF
jgi:hypothetical protein